MNAQDTYGAAPLQLAAGQGHLDVVKFLARQAVIPIKNPGKKAIAAVPQTNPSFNDSSTPLFPPGFQGQCERTSFGTISLIVCVRTRQVRGNKSVRGQVMCTRSDDQGTNSTDEMF